MTQRPSAHIQETESKIAFESLLPSEWVNREQEPDYSLDYQVQIFEGGEATPFYFFAQLKSVDKHLAKPAYSFQTKKLLYYVKQPFPVMLALYCSADKKIYFEWVQKIHNRLDGNELRKWHLQKTCKIELTNELMADSGAQLLNEIKHQAYAIGHPGASNDPINIKIQYENNRALESDMLASIQTLLSESKKTEHIKINSEGNTDGHILIINTEIPLLILHYGEENLPIMISDLNNREVLKLTILKGIALLLNRCGRFQNAVDLLVVLSLDDVFMQLPITYEIPYLSRAFVDSNRIADAINIAEKFINHNQIDNGLAFLVAALHDPDLYSEHYRRALVAALDKTEDLIQKGTLHYNLANSLRNIGNQKDAIKHFGLAVKFHPNYKKRSYWYAELAGSLFLDEKYKAAEKCYQKAYDMGEERLPVLPLLADSILYQGRLKEAHEILNKYFAEEKLPYADFVLKGWLMANFIALFGDYVSRNQEVAIDLIEKAINAEDKQLQERLFNAAIETDPLSGYAWFNFAVFVSGTKENERFMEWLITSILQNWDIEAWANALLSFDNNDRETHIDLFSYVCYESFRLHGSKLEERLIEVLKNQPSTSEQQARHLIDQYKLIYESIRPIFSEDIESIMRIHE